MKTLGIIPARGGSKRVPQKNKRILAGKPLICWILEEAVKASKLDKIVVSSDDQDILKIVGSYPKVLPILRPNDISGDQSLAIEYVRHSLGILENSDDEKYDQIVILQPSSPLTKVKDIDATIQLLETSGADTSVSVVKLDHAIHPAKLKVMENDLLLPYIEEEKGRMASHELPEIYVRNCSVYATTRDTIDRGEIIGPDCRGYVMSREDSVDINDEFDFLMAEFLIMRKLDLNEKDAGK